MQRVQVQVQLLHYKEAGGCWRLAPALVAGRLREDRPRSGGVAGDLGENGEIRGSAYDLSFVFEPCLTALSVKS